MVFVKNFKFFHLFIFGKIRHENLFDDTLEKKKSILDSKIKNYVKKVEESGFFQGS